MNDQDHPHRVVIIGGGFAGLFAIRALRRAPVQVTLIDRRQHHLFQPLLYQCATGILSEGKISAPLRNVLRKHRNVECVLAEVTGIDPGRRSALIANSPANPPPMITTRRRWSWSFMARIGLPVPWQPAKSPCGVVPRIPVGE